MAVGFYTVTAAADPQTVCTAFEAEANISACTVVGTSGESATSVLFPSATAAINDVGDIDSSQTTITYDTLVGEIVSSVPVKITIDSEIMRVTGATATVLTVERAQDGTLGAAHLDDAVITFDADTLAFSNAVVFRVVGTAAADVIAAATAVGGVEVASGYPTPVDTFSL